MRLAAHASSCLSLDRITSAEQPLCITESRAYKSLLCLSLSTLAHARKGNTFCFLGFSIAAEVPMGCRLYRADLTLARQRLRVMLNRL